MRRAVSCFLASLTTTDVNSVIDSAVLAAERVKLLLLGLLLVCCWLQSPRTAEMLNESTNHWQGAGKEEGHGARPETRKLVDT